MLYNVLECLIDLIKYFFKIFIELLSPIIIVIASYFIYKMQSRGMSEISKQINQTIHDNLSNISNTVSNVISSNTNDFLAKYEQGLQSTLEVGFNTRFAEIVSKAIKNESEINNYFSTFWGLQFDQYLQFKRGHVSLDIFASWMLARRLEFKENDIEMSPYHKLTIDGWKSQKGAFKKIDPDFFEFINRLERQEIKEKDDLKNYFKRRKKL